MICQICGQEVNIKGVTLHLRKHKISSKDYYDKYLKKENEGICMFCKKSTEYIGITKGYRIGCCPKHTSLIKYGVNNPAKSNIVKEKVKQ